MTLLVFALLYLLSLVGAAYIIKRLLDRVSGLEKELDYQRMIAQDERRDHSVHLLMLAETAIDTVKATTLQEKALVAESRQAQDVRVAFLRDTLAKDAAAQRVQGPQKITLADGRQMDLSEIEVFG